MQSITLEQLGTDYLNALRHERGCAESTYFTYASWFRHFLNWLAENGERKPDITAFTVQNLRAYQYSLSTRKLRPRTIRAAFHPLRGLGEFLVTHGVIKDNPCKLLTMPKKDAAIRLTISNDEVAKLLEGVERLYPSTKVAIARAIVSTLVYSGVRFQELLDLKIADVCLANGTLLVACGKGSKSRMLYPPKQCMEAIGTWLDARDKECRHEWLWAENKGRRMGEISVRDLLEEVKAVAGLNDHDNIKPHSLRHAFATRMMQNGAPIKAIQSALGHSMVNTTFQYLHLEEQESRKMADFAGLNSLNNLPSTVPAKQGKTPSKATRVQFLQSRRQRTPSFCRAQSIEK